MGSTLRADLKLKNRVVPKILKDLQYQNFDDIGVKMEEDIDIEKFIRF